MFTINPVQRKFSFILQLSINFNFILPVSPSKKQTSLSLLNLSTFLFIINVSISFKIFGLLDMSFINIPPTLTLTLS